MTIRKPLYWLALLLGALLAFAAFSPGASPMADAQSDNPQGTTFGYVRFDDVPGESVDRDHPGWSDILSFQLGAYQSGFGDSASSRPGGGAGKATIEDLIVVKKLDSAGTYLARYAVNGNSLAEVELELAAPNPEGRLVYYEIKLENARITSHTR